MTSRVCLAYMNGHLESHVAELSPAFTAAHGDVDDPGDFERSLFERSVQPLAFHEFHGDKGEPFVRLAHVVHNADVRMVERRSRLGLVEESRTSLRE